MDRPLDVTLLPLVYLPIFHFGSLKVMFTRLLVVLTFPTDKSCELAGIRLGSGSVIILTICGTSFRGLSIVPGSRLRGTLLLCPSYAFIVWHGHGTSFALSNMTINEMRNLHLFL